MLKGILHWQMASGTQISSNLCAAQHIRKRPNRQLATWGLLNAKQSKRFVVLVASRHKTITSVEIRIDMCQAANLPIADEMQTCRG